MPPSWIIFEELSFGTLSHVFEYIRNCHKAEICRYFDLAAPVFVSWLRGLTKLRNRCAHHNRIWNYTYSAVRLPNNLQKTENNHNIFEGIAIYDPKKIQILIYIISYMLRKISHDDQWIKEILAHLETCPIPYQHPMGFQNPEI